MEYFFQSYPQIKYELSLHGGCRPAAQKKIP